MRELKPTVFIVDNGTGSARALRVLMESVELPVETYPGIRGLLESFDVLRPGCLILDVRMPEMSGIELCRRLRKAGSTLPAVFVTAHGDVATAVQAMQEGAFDFLQQPFSEQYLLDRVQAALEKDCRDRRRAAERRAAAARFGTLSAKERRVVDLIVNGMTSKAMARELGIGVKTVDFHRANIMRKVGVETVGELVCLLFKGGYGGLVQDKHAWNEWAKPGDDAGSSRGVFGRLTIERHGGLELPDYEPGDTAGAGVRFSSALR